MICLLLNLVMVQAGVLREGKNLMALVVQADQITAVIITLGRVCLQRYKNKFRLFGPIPQLLKNSKTYLLQSISLTLLQK
ncbi:hypothetical protein C6560_05035 [Enterobacter sp. FS01]|nr:hypothetical protein C6560_05035 [Enterobacter sp. FS01]